MEKSEKKSTDAHIRAVAKYNKENYSTFSVTVSKGQRQIMNAAAEKLGLSSASFVREALAAFLRDQFGITPEEWDI